LWTKRSSHRSRPESSLIYYLFTTFFPLFPKAGFFWQTFLVARAWFLPTRSPASPPRPNRFHPTFGPRQNVLRVTSFGCQYFVDFHPEAPLATVRDRSFLWVGFSCSSCPHYPPHDSSSSDFPPPCAPLMFPLMCRFPLCGCFYTQSLRVSC